MIRNIGAIFKKDIKLYFSSFVAYCIIAIFLVLTGYFFSSLINAFVMISLQVAQQQAYQGPLNLTESITPSLFMNVCIVMLFMLPMLTMRSFSEEKKEGTIELLYTYPISDFEIVIGKYCAVSFVFLIMLAPLFIYPVLIRLVGGVYMMQPFYVGMFGLVLLGLAFLAVGLFISSMTKNQIVSVSITFGTLLMFWVMGWSSTFVSKELGSFLEELSMLQHFSNFAQGLIDTQDILFYCLVIFFFIFFTLRILESRSWKG